LIAPSMAAAILSTAFLARPARAQGVDWSFDASTSSPVDLPAWLPADSVRVALGYEGTDRVIGMVVDFNGDLVRDYVLQFSRAVCGTNCQYALVDGKTRRSLGVVGGSVVFVRGRLINGYPVINAYGHSSADSGYWSTSIYDGRQYVGVDAVWLSGIALERHFEQLSHVRHGPPRGPDP
jgi:hypothetical protein